MENNEIGSRIRELMYRRNINQSKLAESINVSHAAINKVVNNQSVPRDKVIDAICEVYNVSKDWLKYGKGDINSVGSKPGKDKPSADEYLQDYLSGLEKEFLEMRRFFQSQLEAKDRQIEFLMAQLGKPECATGKTGLVIIHPSTGKFFRVEALDTSA